MSDELILTEDNEDLFITEKDPGIDESGDFDPPPLLGENSNGIDKSPVIKFMTPVRRGRGRRKERIRDDDSEDEGTSGNGGGDRFLVPEPVPFSPVRSPKVDLTDDDDVNEHIRKLVTYPGQIDYDKEPDKVQELCEDVFRSKFMNLKVHYPEYEPEYPEGKSLNKIHKYYHGLIKSIYVNMNIGQYETWYLIGLLALEVLMVQVFNIPFGGFTRSELKRMHRKKSMLIELGEEWYPDGTGEKASIQYRLGEDMIWNIITFIAVKFLADWVGGDDMVEKCRSVVETLMDSPINMENIESGEARDIQSTENNIAQDLLGGLGGLGGLNGGLKDILVEVTSQWTEGSSKKKGKKKKKEKVIIFGE
jgi:hypothetical protein